MRRWWNGSSARSAASTWRSRCSPRLPIFCRSGTRSCSPFLTKVLSKATELIGADTGSIAIVEEREGEKWLVVEDEQGNIVGAKNKEWLKKNIPPFRIGGPELPLEERSLTGYVAWSKQPKIIAHVEDEQQGGGFHRSMSDLIKSEIAVPVISDDEVIAVICLNSLKPAYFTEEHKRILQIIDRLTSRHISDIQRIERLQSEVTRLPERRHLQGPAGFLLPAGQHHRQQPQGPGDRRFHQHRLPAALQPHRPLEQQRPPGGDHRPPLHPGPRARPGRARNSSSTTSTTS